MSNRSCLSIGAGPNHGLPAHYQGFRVTTLDVDASTDPDIVADVRDLSEIPDASFDAVYMAHLLEHFPRWELSVVLEQVARVIKIGGFLEVRVPHVQAVFDALVNDGLEIDEALYHSAMGPITALDILFGHEPSLAHGKEAMAHKTAFTPPMLEKVLSAPGLKVELLQPTGGKRFELCGIARKVAEGSELQMMAEEQPLPAEAN